MTDLEGCIQFHESLIFHNRAWLEPATLALEEMTVRFLKQLLEKEKVVKDG